MTPAAGSSGRALRRHEPSINRWVLLALALLLVLCAQLRMDALRLTEMESPAIRADSASYCFYTWNLRQYGVYSAHDSFRDGPPPQADFLRWPGLPLLALPFADDAERMVPRFLMAQTLVSAGAGLLLFALVLQLAGSGAGLAALALYAISPHLINANLYFLTESPMSSLMIGFAFTLLQGLRTHRVGWYCAAGALLGMATLTRPFTEYYAPMLLAFLWLARVPGRGRVVMATGLAFAALVMPWHIAVWLWGPSDATSLGIYSIQHGMYPDFMYDHRPESYGYPYRFDPDTAAIGRDASSVFAELKRRFTTEPGEHLRWFLLGKPLALWQWPLVQGVRGIFIYPATLTPFDFLPHFRAANTLSHWLHYPLLLLAFAGAILAWVPSFARTLNTEVRLFLRAISILFAWTTAMHIIGAPFPRYHMPLKPLLFAMGSTSAVLFLHAARARFNPNALRS